MLGVSYRLTIRNCIEDKYDIHRNKVTCCPLIWTLKEDKDDLTTQTTENSFLQLFEHIGEAIPQFALAITFYYNNFEYVSETDFSFEIFGFLVTQTLISMILSAISILKGIVEGIKSCCKLKAWKTRTEEIP